VVLNPDFPRSLRFCTERMCEALQRISDCGGGGSPAGEALSALRTGLEGLDADSLFRSGLHEFLRDFLTRQAELGGVLAKEFFEAYLGETECAT
jgi:uncharacterized alpha-E superfamily protein